MLFAIVFWLMPENEGVDPQNTSKLRPTEISTKVGGAKTISGLPKREVKNRSRRNCFSIDHCGGEDHQYYLHCYAEFTPPTRCRYPCERRGFSFVGRG